MKFIGKFFLILLLILLVILIAGYFVLKSTWGAATLSRWISDDTAYHLSIGKIRHSFSSPLDVTLQDVTFGHDGQPALLVAGNVKLGLSLLQFSDPSHFDSITLTDGEIDLANSTPDTAIPLQANRLSLNNIRIEQPAADDAFTADRLQADITPWKPAAGSLAGAEYSFRLGIGRLSLSTQQLNDISVAGSVNPQALTLDEIDGKAERGTFSGAMSRDAQGRWQIKQLTLQDTRFQTSKTLPEFLTPLVQHNIRPGQISLNHATIVGPDWAVTDLNMQLNNPQIPDSDLLADGGKLDLQASEFVYGTTGLNDPQIALESTPQGFRINSLSTHWVNGSVNASGDWQRDSRRLTLDKLSLTGLEYTLPENWRQFWMSPLPDWLDSVMVRQLAVSNSLLIDINPDFPFQMTALHATGCELLLAKNHQWGIWSGDSEWQAAEATFNRRDIRAPWLKLHADDQKISVNDLKMLADNGPLIGNAQISQQPSRAFSVSLRGQSVPAGMFADWGWTGGNTPQGKAGVTLNISGNLQAERALRPTVNGSLQLTTPSGTVQQSMQAGVVH